MTPRNRASYSALVPLAILLSRATVRAQSTPDAPPSATGAVSDAIPIRLVEPGPDGAIEITADTRTNLATFAFDAVADRTYTIARAGGGPVAIEYTLVGDIHNASNTVLAQGGSSDPAPFTWTARAAGRYYLIVSLATNDGSDRPNPYTVRITQTQAASSDIDYTLPAPGRVPLTVVIHGGDPYVALPAGPGATRTLCESSPCTLYVPLGRFRFLTNVGAVARTVDVAPGGTHVEYGWRGALGFSVAALTVGIAAPVVGAFFVGFADGDRGALGTGLGLLIGGLGLGLTGGLMLTFLAAGFSGDERHVHYHHHDRRSRRGGPAMDWTAGATPLPGGAAASATLRF